MDSTAHSEISREFGELVNDNMDSKASTVADQTPVATTKSLHGNVSGLSPAELVLVERSQDSVQVTKKRMERQHRDDSDASCDTFERPRLMSSGQQKKAKTRFFAAGQSDRKSVGRRISEAFGIKKSEHTSSSKDTEGHVKFQKVPEIID